MLCAEVEVTTTVVTSRMDAMGGDLQPGCLADQGVTRMAYSLRLWLMAIGW